MTRPSIAELRRALSGMTPAPWEVPDVDDPVASLVELRRQDAIGIVALRNAAPVLLEIAAAALRSIVPCDPRCEDGYHAGSCAAHAGRTELALALAKVAP